MDRLLNLLLLSAVYLYALVRGSATTVSSNSKNVLVVQNAKLGDMVCTTPVFRALKQHLPGVRVFVMGNKINREVLRGNPDVDGYLVSDGSFLELLREVRKHRFDFGCVLTPDSRAFSLLFLAGAKAIVAPEVVGGFCPWETKTYRALRRKGIIVPHRMGHYAPREYLRTLEPLGIVSEDTHKHLHFSVEAAEKVSNLFAQAGVSPGEDFVVGISPAAGNRIKQWPAERFGEVANQLSEHYGAKVVVLGGPTDTKEVEIMTAVLSKDVKVLQVAGKLSIEELKAMVSKLSLFISVDTGPIYIAEAFGVPTIDITGPIDETEQPPIGPLHRVVVPPQRARPELHVMNAKMYNAHEARRQTESITVEMVLDVFKEMRPALRDSHG